MNRKKKTKTATTLIQELTSFETSTTKLSSLFSPSLSCKAEQSVSAQHVTHGQTLSDISQVNHLRGQSRAVSYIVAGVLVFHLALLSVIWKFRPVAPLI